MNGPLDDICDFIRSDIGFKGNIDPEADLLEERILDSFNVVELATFVQEHFGVELQAEDLVRDNFARLSSLVAWIERRQAET